VAALTLSPNSRRGRGFALLIVLWTLVLIALIAGHLAAGGRIETRIAYNLSANAAAEAARDGAITAAIFNLMRAGTAGGWSGDGTPHMFDIGESRVEVRVANEAGRVNPNLASPELLGALLVIAGTDPDTAQRLAAAIGQWIGTATAEAADTANQAYRAAGLDHTPPFEPLQTIDELTRVIGMDPAIVDMLRPHLTLYGSANPDPAAADPAVRAALDYLRKRNQAPSTPVLAPTAANQAPQTFRITARAHGPGNARSAATAVVRLTGAFGQGYVLLAWEESTD
jgi:general secretion pathway protein K